MSDIANMCFKRAVDRDLSVYKSDLQMYNILAAVDGSRSVRKIAEENFYELDFLIEKVNQLLEAGMLIPVHEGESGNIDQKTIEFLHLELTRIVGPVADSLIKNSASKFGHSIHNFPLEKANELIDMISKVIKTQGDVDDFKQRIFSRLKR